MIVVVVILDTSGIVAARNVRDVNHAAAVSAMKSILKGIHGQAIVTDFIFDETVTTALVRGKSLALAVDAGNFILKSSCITLDAITREDFHEAWRLFNDFSSNRLSFTDCTTIAFARRREANYILTFDSQFDGILARVC